MGGASVAQQLLDAELVDELRLDVMPVLLGTGRRFFDNASLERVRLEKIDVGGWCADEPQVPGEALVAGSVD